MLALASTYAPQHCGIGAYSGQLARALVGAMPDTPPIVLSEIGARNGVEDGVESLPTFSRREDFSKVLLDAAIRARVRVVHIQHAPDIFGTDDRLIRLCDGLRAHRIASVVTLHTVHSWGTGAWRGFFNVPSFHRRLGNAADALIVHGESRSAETLRAHGAPADRVHIIPLGTPDEPPRITRAEARAALGVSADTPLLVCVGFLRRAKRLETLIRAFRYVHERAPACRLILAGSVQNASVFESWYPRYLQRLIRWYGLEGVVTLRQGFLTDEDLVRHYVAADLVLLPYGQRYGSGSMALHTALAARRLPICSRIPKFAEVGEHLSPDLLVAPGDAAAWARAIEGGLAQAREPAIQSQIEAFAEHTSWSHVAAQHAALYRSLQARS